MHIVTGIISIVQVSAADVFHSVFYLFVPLQGYPSELLPVTVAGIPSMHICLDYIPELLSQPQMDKQVNLE